MSLLSTTLRALMHRDSVTKQPSQRVARAAFAANARRSPACSLEHFAGAQRLRMPYRTRHPEEGALHTASRSSSGPLARITIAARAIAQLKRTLPYAPVRIFDNPAAVVGAVNWPASHSSLPNEEV